MPCPSPQNVSIQIPLRGYLKFVSNLTWSTEVLSEASFELSRYRPHPKCPRAHLP